MNVGDIRRRALVLTALFACAFTGLLGRLGHLQVVRHAGYAAAVDRQNSKTVTIRPTRGPIVDRHGEVLADSSPAQALYVHPKRVRDPARLAERLAPLLGGPASELADRLTSDRGFVLLRRQLPPPVAQAVRAFGEAGLVLEPDTIRLYPNRELAAHVVGFAGADGGGLGGIERAWDAHLAGSPGQALVERDALGRDVSAAPLIVTPPRPGGGVSLTIDRTIQYLAEREIEVAYRRTRARAAMALVMDPRTGEILASAIRPTFNPNRFAAASAHDRRNRAITDPFEPGSTFKVILAAAALEQGVVKPDDRMYAGDGVIRVANTTIRDWRRHGWLTFAEVLQNSSNVGAIKVGLALGREPFYRYITDFGFGSPTNVGLPGESRGRVRELSRWSGLSLPSMSIGQEISVTALQLVAAFGAVANGGRLMRPLLVRALLDADGRETQTFEPRVLRQVILPQTANTLTRLLVGVVDHGTGHAAAVPGFEVGGKTGTAQKLDSATRRYSHAPGVLSFVGFAPADEPRFVMLVLLDEPQNEQWGSEAAAPVFSAIAGEILRYLGVPARDIPPLRLVASAPTALSDRSEAMPGAVVRDRVDESGWSRPTRTRAVWASAEGVAGSHRTGSSSTLGTVNTAGAPEPPDGLRQAVTEATPTERRSTDRERAEGRRFEGSDRGGDRGELSGHSGDPRHAPDHLAGGADRSRERIRPAGEPSHGGRAARSEPSTVVGPHPAAPHPTELQPEALPLMPKVIGLTLRQALSTLSLHGVPVQARGTGVVIAQTPDEGEPLGPDTLTHLELSPR